MTPVVRPITDNDLDNFDHHGYSVRGFIIEMDDKYLAVFGVLHSVPLQAFSSMEPELEKYPKIIMKAILSFKGILSKYNTAVYAIASKKHKNSSKVLERIGFKHLGEGKYKWKE